MSAFNKCILLIREGDNFVNLFVSLTVSMFCNPKPAGATNVFAKWRKSWDNHH